MPDDVSRANSSPLALQPSSVRIKPNAQTPDTPQLVNQPPPPLPSPGPGPNSAENAGAPDGLVIQTSHCSRPVNQSTPAMFSVGPEPTAVAPLNTAPASVRDASSFRVLRNPSGGPMHQESISARLTHGLKNRDAPVFWHPQSPASAKSQDTLHMLGLAPVPFSPSITVFPVGSSGSTHNIFSLPDTPPAPRLSLSPDSHGAHLTLNPALEY